MTELQKKHSNEFYDEAAADYHIQYERDSVSNIDIEYPANFFRMQMLINSFVQNDIKRVIEIGVGEGTPLANLCKAGMDVSGIDISDNMVERAKENIAKFGGDSDKIIWGDIQEPSSYVGLLDDGKFDGLLAMGVTPHVENDLFVLRNMRNLVRPGGKVFIEYRNSMFSMFTFNRYTHDFIMDELLDGVSPRMKDIVSENIKPRLEMDKPAERTQDANTGGTGYDAILSKFHNPFEIQKIYKNNGFEDINLLWYHYHPAMPFLEEKDREEFRKEAVKMEYEDSGWKGLFLCSAFVVEATVSA